MTLRELVLKNRSYRRFYEEVDITMDTLREMADLGRLTPSAGNNQIEKFYLCNDRKMNDSIFECLAWAGYLKDWDGPKKGERPSAYIILMTDLNYGKDLKQDEGIRAQTIMLGAVEQGYGGCMLGAVNREKLIKVLNLDPKQYRIDLVLALGKPKEEIVLEDATDDIKYYRVNEVHHVPKRTLQDVIIDH